MGLEPTRPIGHKILSLACLPISALPRDKVYISTAEGSWQQLFFIFRFCPRTFSLPFHERGQTPSWHRYESALSAMGSDPLASRRFTERAGVRPLGLSERMGSAPSGRPIVYGTGSWSDPHSLSLILFCFRRGQLRVLRGELCLAGLDVLLNGLLRAFVDGTALLTAEGLHQAHVVGV